MRGNRRVDPILLPVLVFLLGSTDPLTGDSSTIPGIVNTSGLNGTHFVSDLALTNPGTASANVSVSLVPSASIPAKSLVLNPGQTVVYRDIVGGFFASPGIVGALSISSDQSLLLRARTYNNAGVGTYGVALPVFSDQTFLGWGEVAHSLWVSQSPDATAGYRTNIAVMFPDESGGEATVTVYDADGNELGSQDFSRGSAGFQQIPVASFAGAVVVGRARLQVTSGRAAGYAVVNDNVTGDSSLFTFEDLPGGIQDVLVNGVARANGRNGTFFRTDGRFYNPTDSDATVTVAFHASANSNASPVTASFNLRAGKIRDVVDVLDTLLGLPVGSSGALRFRSNLPVGILCRTSNVDPQGIKPGTFGSQQKPVPLLSFLSSADAGAVVAGIRQNAAFRTNVGFAAGGDGAGYTLTLKSAGGATTATTSASLGSFGWTQPSVQDLFPGVTIPDDAALQVKVTSGSVDIYDSSIDNTSGDSVLTPIAPLPENIPSSATIGPQGGSIRSDDGRLTLRVPAGALTSSVTLSWTTNAANAAPQGAGASYTLSPGDVVFSKPATLLFRYSSVDTDGSAAGALGLAFKSGDSWLVAKGGAVNSGAGTLTVPIASALPLAAAAPASRGPLVGPNTVAWAPFRSVEIFPKKAALFTGTSMNLIILFVGGSSSDALLVGVPLGPFNPASLLYEWRANTIFLGDAANGVIHENGSAGTYTAPSCPPTRNPVLISVKISKNDGSTWWVPVSLRANVVARKWKLKIEASSEALCSGPQAQEISDKLGWTLTTDFELDDDFRFEQSDPPRDVTETFGTPRLCVTPGCGSVTRISREEEPVKLSTLASLGHWDPDAEVMTLRVQVAGEGPGKYMVLLNCGGYESTVPYFGDVCSFDFFGTVHLTPRRRVTIRPEFIEKNDQNKDRLTTNIALRLDAVCP